MIDPRFALIAALLPILGSIKYVYDTIRGTTRPNRVSWVLWSLAPGIALAAEVVEHAPLSTMALTFAVGFGPLTVVLASLLNLKAYWQISGFDWWCGGLSVCALVGWLLSGQGWVAVGFSILADGLASVPTIRKAFADPGSETASAFYATALASLITLGTIRPGEWSFVNCGFTLYILVVTSFISIVILWPRKAMAG